MTVKDPVCGQVLETTTTEGRSDYDGHAYYFCSHECQNQFEQDPLGVIVAAYSR